MCTQHALFVFLFSYFVDFFRTSSLSNQISAHLFRKLVVLLQMKLADQLAYQTINYAVGWVCVCVSAGKAVHQVLIPFIFRLRVHFSRVVSPARARGLVGVCVIVWIADSLICQTHRSLWTH